MVLPIFEARDFRLACATHTLFETFLIAMVSSTRQERKAVDFIRRNRFADGVVLWKSVTITFHDLLY